MEYFVNIHISRLLLLEAISRSGIPPRIFPPVGTLAQRVKTNTVTRTSIYTRSILVKKHTIYYNSKIDKNKIWKRNSRKCKETKHQQNLNSNTAETGKVVLVQDKREEKYEQSCCSQTKTKTPSHATFCSLLRTTHWNLAASFPCKDILRGNIPFFLKTHTRPKNKTAIPANDAAITITNTCFVFCS
jgi:hypothetical protein